MNKIVNLNKARKRKARQEAAVKAAENRVRHGRTKAEKQRDAMLAAEAEQRMDGLRREDPGKD